MSSVKSVKFLRYPAEPCVSCEESTLRNLPVELEVPAERIEPTYTFEYWILSPDLHLPCREPGNMLPTALRCRLQRLT